MSWGKRGGGTEYCDLTGLSGLSSGVTTTSSPPPPPTPPQQYDPPESTLPSPPLPQLPHLGWGARGPGRPPRVASSGLRSFEKRNRLVNRAGRLGQDEGQQAPAQKPPHVRGYHRYHHSPQPPAPLLAALDGEAHLADSWQLAFSLPYSLCSCSSCSCRSSFLSASFSRACLSAWKSAL